MVAADCWLDRDNIKVEKCMRRRFVPEGGLEKLRKTTQVLEMLQVKVSLHTLYDMVYVGSTHLAPRILNYSSNRWCSASSHGCPIPEQELSVAAELQASCAPPPPPKSPVRLTFKNRASYI
jgi:hypothetical protein